MKNRRSVICMLLALLLVLAGCAKANVSGAAAPAEETKAAPTGTIAQTEAPETTQAPETTAAPEETTAENPLSLGRMEGGTYSNAYAGFACDLDSDWTYYSAEELQELPENSKALLEGTEVGETVEGLEYISDMMAENVNELATINVLFQKMSMQERLLYAVMSEDELMDAVLTQSDTLISSYAQAGMDVTSMEKATFSFLGEERTGIRTVGSSNGVDFYILQVFDYGAGQYSVTLTLTSFLEDKTESLLELFYPVE